MSRRLLLAIAVSMTLSTASIPCVAAPSSNGGNPLDELKAEIAQLRASLQHEVDRLDGAVAELQKSHANLAADAEARLLALRGAVTDLQASAGRHERSLEDVEGRLNEQSSAISLLRVDLTSLGQEVDQKHDGLTEALREVDERATAVMPAVLLELQRLERRLVIDEVRRERSGLQITLATLGRMRSSALARLAAADPMTRAALQVQVQRLEVQIAETVQTVEVLTGHEEDDDSSADDAKEAVDDARDKQKMALDVISDYLDVIRSINPQL